jgi:hypothetical protein
MLLSLRFEAGSTPTTHPNFFNYLALRSCRFLPFKARATTLPLACTSSSGGSRKELLRGSWKFGYDFSMAWQWIVTTSIAAYAAVLSTYNVIASRKKETHQITVKLSYGFIPVGPELGDEMMLVEAANHGHRSVTVQSAGLLLPDRRQLFFMNGGSVRLPHHLNEGTSCTQWTPLAVIKEELRKSGLSGKVKVIGFYLDALNNRHLSEPAEIGLHRSQ